MYIMFCNHESNLMVLSACVAISQHASLENCESLRIDLFHRSDVIVFSPVEDYYFLSDPIDLNSKDPLVFPATP